MSKEKPEKKGNKKAEEKKNANEQEFVPERFSVKDLRRHQSPKTSRNPKVIR
ncbi:hypothetical protein SAMN05421747_116118 [Parapedobacter composti]|uniref:Uncharacterized protein n=1 Tax=Parapedobacter composti TaxID=623281 RepID=A0A1I1KP41_9SPHI|nr:hypothetical protein [Parapedobacter composti]SFC62549.1 hypothetical protein SAMN05421747_116118 [Parapedobacter composti]